MKIRISPETCHALGELMDFFGLVAFFAFIFIILPLLVK